MNIIKKISGLQRNEVWSHLRGLDKEDQALRFGYLMVSEKITEYVLKINFNRDLIVGLFNDEKLIGFCHGVSYEEKGIAVAEVGISIDKKYRANGDGHKMLECLFDLAKQKSIKKIHIHTLARNYPMRKILKKMNGEISIFEDEVTMSFNVGKVEEEEIMGNYFLDGIEVIEKKVDTNSPTLLFVHGAGGDAWQWRRNFMPFFAKENINTVAISLPNHGKSKKDDNYSLEECLEIINFWKEKCGAKCVLVGHSMGGFLLQKYAADYEVDNKIILLASMPPFNLSTLDSSFVNLIEDQLDCFVAKNNLNRLLNDAKPIDTENIKSELIFVAGTQDKVIPLAWNKKASHHYRAKLHVVEGGHNLMINKSWKDSAQIILNSIE
ncbi:MAG: alpha/beta fold hydrolase [Candidatus Sericytochromatia bacterium]|nr:alpha/beta fold hydrolase [Candidatus Sericytochromatia bacterium]